MPPDPAARLAAEVAQATAGLVPERLGERRRTTHINDPIWGFIELQPHEMCLLDTPLLQRLRNIRQLAGAHLAFPGALHTRFDHTLGVTHVTGMACEALKRASPDDIDATAARNLRAAAMCHDLGHGPFSHSSELFFEALAPMPDVVAAHKGSAAEHLAAAIVGSPALVAFIGMLNDTYGTDLDPQFMAAAIRGALPRDQAHLGEVIHGPIDADKLDYLIRDSKCCGITNRPNAERIINSLEFATHEGRRRLVGKGNGAAALMQLVAHKQFMFAVVYRHRVARTFHAMLQVAWQAAVADGTTVAGRPLSSPADFLRLDDALMLAPGVVSPGRAADLLADLRERRLYKTALAIDGYELDEDARGRLAAEASALGEAIATRVGAPAHQVIVNVAPRLPNSEARGMLIRKRAGGGLVPLGEVLDLRDGHIPLHRFTESHHVLCPAGIRDQVTPVAHGLLREVVPAASLAKPDEDGQLPLGF